MLVHFELSEIGDFFRRGAGVVLEAGFNYLADGVVVDNEVFTECGRNYADGRRQRFFRPWFFLSS